MDSRAQGIEAVITAYCGGKIVLLIDDTKVEADGAMLCAAPNCTDATVNFMCIHARGIVAVGLTADRCRALGLELQPQTHRGHVQFTTSVEASEGISTGISAADRALTIDVLGQPNSGPGDLVSPGHIFPVLVHAGGVIGRPAAAEAAVDLAKLGGCTTDAGVYCDVLSASGELASQDQLETLAETLSLPILMMSDLQRYRLSRECLVREIESGSVPTRYGQYNVSVWENMVDQSNHVLLTHGEINPDNNQPAPLVRVHSQCLTGDVFMSARCDCGEQLDAAMLAIGEQPSGGILYLRQEGRGIGLVNKLKAYALQERGLDTVQANEELGFKADQRDYSIGAQILHEAGFRRIRLLTNNPHKLQGIQSFGLKVE